MDEMGVTWAVILFAASIVLVGMGAYAWHRRMTPGARSFSLLMFATAGYALTYGLELLGPDLLVKTLWLKAQYPFIVTIPLLWLIFALQYTGQGPWLSRRNILLLSLVPAITILIVWTNEAHHLYYTSTGIEERVGWALLQLEYGPWFWVHITYSYLCLLGGTLLLAGAVFRGTRLYRNQAAVLLLGAMIPWLGNLLYLTRATPWPNLDLAPLTFTLTSLVVAYGLFRYRLLQVVPVARRAVVDGLPAAMVVLDAEGQIADLNPVARRLFNLGDRDVIGQPARQVLGPQEVVARFAGVTETDTTIDWGQGDERRVYRVTINPVGDGQAGASPRLILISDVTAQVLAQEDLSHSNLQLHLLHEIAQVAASTLDLPALYQALADTLAQIIGGDGCYITHVDELSGEVVGGAAYGPFRDSYQGLKPPPGEQTLTESVLAHGRPLAVEDVFDSPYISPRIAEMFPARSQLGVPLRVGERNLGAVLIAFNQPHVFAEEEIVWATQAVNLAAVALENARLFQRVEHSRRTWEATFDAMPDLIAILDDEHQIVRANKAMADRLGAKPEETIGLICYECVHGTNQPPADCPHTQLLVDGQEHIAEIYEERLGGTFVVGVSPLHDAEGQLVGAVHVAHDITARKQAEEERERLILELQEALAQVKTLSGLLPICANCKKIRDDEGTWHSLEVYVRERSDADFSHSICPECMRDLYPWYAQGEDPAAEA